MRDMGKLMKAVGRNAAKAENQRGSKKVPMELSPGSGGSKVFRGSKGYGAARKGK